MVRGFVTFLVVVLALVFQSTLIEFISINHITFNLLLITSVSYGIIRGKFEGAIVGFSIGLLQDVFFGNVIGLYSLLYMYIGFLSGYFNRSFYRDRVLMPISIIVVADFILNIMIYIFTYLFRGRTDLGTYLIRIIIPEMTYTILVSIFIYRFYLLLHFYIKQYEDRKRGKNVVK